jgi:aspartyl-tRNA(Asn)/glutamyl-tRNA(Gln) amidotransferase subunit B
MGGSNSYEVVVGLEVHAQLMTKSKLFCGDSIAFGAEPNTHVSPITLAHPGTLPKMNTKAIELAVRMGLACHSTIEKRNYFARKNYFYPDLPKGYQISQHTTPICKGGYIKIRTAGGEKHIRLNRIHLEEDAGKSVHDADPEFTCIDYNRSGTPLVEIVTEPDIRSAEEAFTFLTEIRKLVRYLDVCDGNMEQGSLRCDANISVRRMGETTFGTKVEVKNLNSIRNVKRAIEFESRRLTGLIEKGEVILQQTRSFDANNGITFATRDKEEADDYRYFADPDLTPFQLEDDLIDSIRRSIPALQEERVNKYVSGFNLPEYDARVLTEERTLSDYFDLIPVPSSLQGEVPESGWKKAAANWLLGPVKSWLNENNREIIDFPVSPGQMAKLIMLVEEGQVSFSAASTKLFSKLLAEPLKDPEEIAVEENLIQQSGADILEPMIDNVLRQYAGKVTEYKNGKKGLLALFVGEVMKQSKGKADPKVTNEMILKKLNS